jgi:tetratricopeptide (TPR) repeat protein
MKALLPSLGVGWVASCAALLFTLPARADPPPTAASATVIGPNAMLADGAAALMNGNWERGVQLTQMGLTATVSNEDRAAGYANLCAGYTALKKYERAIESCDQSLAIATNNWRAWQNRAAANLGLGRIDESLHDIQHGLAINPESQDLQKTLAIARSLEKLQQERMDHLLES